LLVGVDELCLIHLGAEFLSKEGFSVGDDGGLGGSLGQELVKAIGPEWDSGVRWALGCWVCWGRCLVGLTFLSDYFLD
jgi:hypothetical protein